MLTLHFLCQSTNIKYEKETYTYLYFQGILSPININGENSSVHLDGPWSITGYPLDVKNNTDLQTQSYSHSQIKTGEGPLLFEGILVLPEGEQPLDTFIDITGWGKVVEELIYVQIYTVLI